MIEPIDELTNEPTNELKKNTQQTKKKENKKKTIKESISILFSFDHLDSNNRKNVYFAN